MLKYTYLIYAQKEETKVDGVKLNQKDIEIIPYDYKEEELQKNYDRELSKICEKVECKWTWYKPPMVKNAAKTALQ